MKITSLFFVILLFITNTIVGQSLNEYKYVIIPSKYDFQKSEDQYQLNSLTKFLFEKEGFTVTYNNIELPAEIANNPCSALTATVNNESNMFTTKLIIELKNCKNQKVLVTEEGRSKEKNYKSGYQEALRKAFESITEQNYNYTGINKEIVAINDRMAVLQKELKPSTNKVEVVEEISKVNEYENEASEMVEVVEIENVVESKKQQNQPSTMLYAQANALGYQLVDSTPKVVYILLNSSKKDVFLLKDKSGMVYKQNGIWFVEYYNQNELVKKPLEIKF